MVVVLVAASGLGSLPALRSGTATTSVTSPDGIQLNLILNSTNFLAGQKLNIAVSIVNTLPKTNIVRTSSDWKFLGVPVALWPPCYYGIPAQIVVVQGDYGLAQLERIANVNFNIACMESVSVDHVVFQPSSNQANLTGLYDVFNNNQTLGPFRLTQNFSTSGYWNLRSLAGELNIPIIGDGGNPTTPPDSSPFAPGIYTVGVADEWGQTVVEHFTVFPSGSEGLFIYLTNDCHASGAGGYIPCFRTTNPYLFNCSAAASTSQGCTQTVTSILAPHPSYIINIRFPFIDSSMPWANCRWIVSGAAGADSGNAHCFSINSSSFVVGIHAPSHP